MKLTCLMAQTLDGLIAKDRAHFPDWTEKADKVFFMKRTKQSGVMIMGRTTFETLPGVLPGRLHVVLSRKAGEWDEREKNLVYTSLSPQRILEKLKKLGYENPILAGGAIINSLFARENLIDELIITISPVIFGSGLGVFENDISLNLELIKQEPLGEKSLVAWYEVKK
jgi:dihydrofolate reductase